MSQQQLHSLSITLPACPTGPVTPQMHFGSSLMAIQAHHIIYSVPTTRVTVYWDNKCITTKEVSAVKETDPVMLTDGHPRNLPSAN